MRLEEKILPALKDAMRQKNTVALEALRAIKSAIILAKTEAGASEVLTDEQELKILQKLVKQRKDSAAIFETQNRQDLATPELEQAEVIAQYLPQQLSEEAIVEVVMCVINETGASGMKDMGRVMGLVSKELSGQADGKTISNIVRAQLGS